MRKEFRLGCVFVVWERNVWSEKAILESKFVQIRIFGNLKFEVRKTFHVNLKYRIEKQPGQSSFEEVQIMKLFSGARYLQTVSYCLEWLKRKSSKMQRIDQILREQSNNSSSNALWNQNSFFNLSWILVLWEIRLRRNGILPYRGFWETNNGLCQRD